MPRTYQIHEQPNRPGHTCRQLAIKRISAVNVGAFAILRDQQATLLVGLVRIVARDQRLKMIVPGGHEVQAALLHPARKIFLRNLIGVAQYRMIGLQNFDWRLLDRNPRAAEFGWIGREVAAVEVRRIVVMFNHQRSPVFDKLQKLAVIACDILLGVVGTHSENDAAELGKVLGRQLLRGENREIHADLLQHCRRVLTCALNVSHIETFGNLHVSIVDVKVPKGLKVAYIQGAGEDTPTVLQQVGMNLTVLPAEKLATEDLSQFGSIVLGVRTYDAQKDVAGNNGKLLKFVENGGTLVVEHNNDTSDFNGGHFTPYPAELGRSRVSVEQAPVEILQPDHPVLRYPNKITQEDFAGWVQERGLYFMTSWDDHF